MSPKDVLLTWTPWTGSLRERLMLEHKARGGLVIVGENGYFMPDKVRRWTFGINGTNGRGVHLPRNNGPRRWEELRFPASSWREDGVHILICGQRGVRADSPTISCDPSWPDRVIRKLLAHTNRPIWYRPHPGRQLAMPSSSFGGRVQVVSCEHPLRDQLAGAWACVTYCSTAIVEAVIRGIPSFYDAPYSIAAPVASNDVCRIERPICPDRSQWLWNLASWQFTDHEVAQGLPFAPLLEAVAT